MLQLSHITFLAQSAYRTPADLRVRYRSLYAQRVEPLPGGGARLGSARRFTRGGVNVLYLHGDRFEMAYQHGRLLSDAIAQGSLSQASQIAHHGIVNSVGSGLLGKAVLWYTEHAIVEQMLQHSLALSDVDPGQHLAEAYGLSEGSGVPVRTLIHAALGPEAAQVLVGQTEDGLTARGLGVGAGINHCTSAVAWGEATATGELVIGRNTDYPLNGYYDAHPTLIYIHPTDGTQRMMTTTTAGFHNAGVCGMNESGIYLAVHTVVTQSTSGRGTPVFMIGQEVLRKAHDFDEAVELLRRAAPAAGWSYHLVSTRERKVATLEMANDHSELRPSQGCTHVTTNHWLTPAMRERYLSLSATVDEDSESRKARAEQLLAEQHGRLDGRSMASLLGDKLDMASGRERSFPNTISSHTTVSSSVWLPDRQKMYLAAGAAPTSNGTFVEFPTLDAFDPESFESSAFETFANDAFQRRNPGAARAETLYIEARKAYEFSDDFATALDHLRKAVAADPGNPAYQLMLSMMAARADRLEEAEAAARAVTVAGWDGARTAVAHYLLGRFAAHRGDGAAATASFEAASSHPKASEKLRRAADRSASRTRRRGRLPFATTDIAIMMLLPDAYRYTGLLPWSN